MAEMAPLLPSTEDGFMQPAYLHKHSSASAAVGTHPREQHHPDLRVVRQTDDVSPTFVPLTPEEIRQKQIDQSWEAIAPDHHNVATEIELAWTQHALQKDQADHQEAETHIDELNEQIDAQDHDALTDPLTGLPNRDGFMLAAKEMYAADSSNFRIGFLDVDRFKALNDTFGHDNADKVLIKIANALQRHIIDTGIGVAGRRSGDEFEIAMKDLSDAEAQQLLATILGEVQSIGLSKSPLAENEYDVIDKRTLDTSPTAVANWNTSVSIGVATASGNNNFQQLLVAADHNMLRAKEAGRNGYKIS